MNDVDLRAAQAKRDELKREPLPPAEAVAGPQETEGKPHDWRFDEVSNVFRCWHCMVRGDWPHLPTCPKTDTITYPAKETP